jgi:hypothetical protein
MVTFAIIVTKVVGCHGESTTFVLVVFVFCLFYISIFAYIEIQGKWLK